MNFKKKVSGSWVDAPHYLRGTDTDTITSLPTTIYADGQSASAVIKGNLSQSGTPTTSSPIYPSECGDIVTSGEHAGQYEIPILCGNTTTNVYLGEVQSTRQIKKYEFTGQETPTWAAVITDTDAYQFPNETSDYKREQFICSHMPVNTYSTTTNTHGYIGQRLTLCFDKSMGLDTTAKVQQYLADQYAAGTPVCVWYVLATPQTTTLNEPIRKIGTYSDSISNVASIPTTSGSQTFDVDTTLKPSEVQLTYHGWHSHEPKEYSGGSWT